MNDVVFDIETNGFLDDLDTVHCLVLKDLSTGRVLSCTDVSPDYPGIEEGLEVLSKAKRIYGHNVVRFDFPAILKVYPGFEWAGEVLDTIVATRLRFAHIKASDFKRAKRGTLPTGLIGRQSIESWGYRLGGKKKTNYKQWCKENGIEEPFAVWRPEMQEYCEDDVEVNETLVLKLRQVGIPEKAMEADMKLAWYLAQQERNGWPVDEEHLHDYINTLTDRKLELEEALIDHFGSWYVFDKELTPKVNNSRYGYVKGATVSKIKLVEFNPNSRHHIADRLIKLYGWEPESYTPTGQPEVNESTLDGLDLPMSDELNEYLLVKKRLGQVADGKQAWTKHLTPKGYQGGALTGMQHIHHSISQVTVTHRHRHSHPNLGQVPRLGTPYGEESRGTFTVPDGWKLVGSDASGLELRCLAHYMAKYDGGEYGKAILEGRKEDKTDIHSLNQKALGLPDDMPEGSLYATGRDVAKTFIYAWLYGAGNEKIGSILDPRLSSSGQKKLGAAKKKEFLRKTPALKYLQNAVKKAANRGYVRLPDGRKAFIRHKHAALNTLLQGAGSIIVKHWIIELNRRLQSTFGSQPGGGWEDEWAACGWIHDEVQIAAREDNAQEVADILVDSMPPIGEKFNWRIPLAADADIGDSWADTH